VAVRGGGAPSGARRGVRSLEGEAVPESSGAAPSPPAALAQPAAGPAPRTRPQTPRPRSCAHAPAAVAGSRAAHRPAVGGTRAATVTRVARGRVHGAGRTKQNGLTGDRTKQRRGVGISAPEHRDGAQEVCDEALLRAAEPVARARGTRLQVAPLGARICNHRAVLRRYVQAELRGESHARVDGDE